MYVIIKSKKLKFLSRPLRKHFKRDLKLIVTQTKLVDHMTANVYSNVDVKYYYTDSGCGGGGGYFG